MTGDPVPRATRWHCQPDPGTLATEVARVVLAAAEDAIARRGVFKIVLAGGQTPAAVYRLLCAAGATWPAWQIYFGDERCLPRNHPQRNDAMVSANWLDSIEIPPDNVHRVPAELGADVAARIYTETVHAARPFDLVLLGMGEDGHTASLFPGQDLDVAGPVVAVHDAPKPPPERVSLAAAALNDSRHMVVMVSGRNKQTAVRRWKQGAALPVTAVCSHHGVDVYVDAAAAPD